MASGDTKTNQYLDIAANGTRADLPSDTCCETRSQTLIRGVAERIMDVEDEVERLENNPDVADIVATYADLQAYDTSQLTDKDVIRVLQDETHDGDSTYYRWSTETQTWTYIGESKQYTDFVGTDGTTAGESGLVPAPATTDADKFLKSDGTWDDVSGGIPTDATFWGQSYDATNNKVDGPLVRTGIAYASGTEGAKFQTASSNGKVLIVRSANGAFGYDVNFTSNGTMPNPTLTFADYYNGQSDAAFTMGRTSNYGAVAAHNVSHIDLWMSSNGLATGTKRQIKYLADPTDQYDAATKNYTDNLAISYSALNGSSAPTTATEGKYVGQLYFDTTNDKKYYLKAIDTTTDPDTYTWEEFGGGGIPTDATFWGRSYDATNNTVSGDIYFDGSGTTLRSISLASSSHLRFQGGGFDFYRGNNRLFGVSTAQVIVEGKPIRSVADPTLPQDAATKNYVDTHGAVAFPTETFNEIVGA